MKAGSPSDGCFPQPAAAPSAALCQPTFPNTSCEDGDCQPLPQSPPSNTREHCDGKREEVEQAGELAQCGPVAVKCSVTPASATGAARLSSTQCKYHAH